MDESEIFGQDGVPCPYRMGKVYEVLSIERDWYRIVDDSGEDYLYPPELFELVND